MNELEKEIIRKHHSEMGKKRWLKVSKEEMLKKMSEYGKKGAKARWAKVSPEERSAYFKKIRAKKKVDLTK